MYYDKRKLAVVALLTILILGIGVGGVFLATRSRRPAVDAPVAVDPARENALRLAREYLDSGEYQRALDILDRLLIADAGDEEARALQSNVLAARRERDRLAEEASRQERRELEEELARLRAQAESATAPDPDLQERIAAAEARRREEERIAREAQLELERERRIAREEEERRRAAEETARREEEERRRLEEERRVREEEERLARLDAEARERAERVRQLVEKGHESLKDDDFLAARGHFNDALRIETDAPRALSGIALSLVEENVSSATNRTQAREYADRAIAQDADFWEPYYVRGRVFQETRDFRAAIRELSRAVELSPPDEGIDALFRLANAQFDAGRFSDARRSYENVVHIDSSHGRALYNLALTHERLGDRRAALNVLGRAVSVRPDHMQSHLMMGNLLRSEANLPGAVEAYRRATQLAETTAQRASTLRALATTLYEMERFDEAATHFRDVVRLEPGNAANNHNMALVLLGDNKDEEALRFAAEAVRISPNEPEYNYTLGQVVASLGSPDSAVGYFERAIELNPEYVKPRVEISAILIAEGRYEDALRQLQAAYRIDRTSAEVNDGLGDAYRLAGRYDDSIRHYQAAIQADPNNASSRFHLALSYISAQRLTSARDALSAVINLDARYWEAYHRLGEVYIRLNDAENAKKVLNTLLAENPQYARKGDVESILASL
ncbi:MAG: tetratricopeptide repeat protein [Spirochaetaceae bacterium]|nr:MAG: tetratricopeptide repeat protein [Spirochaetaceae bacterium]